MFARQQLERAKEEKGFPCGPCRDVVGQSPARRKVSTEAEDIVGIRYQTTIDEDRVDWEG
jgi:hypothetical protein